MLAASQVCYCCAGLDARAAVIVMHAVKNISKGGRTVLVTIHQPSIGKTLVQCCAHCPCCDQPGCCMDWHSRLTSLKVQRYSRPSTPWFYYRLVAG